MASPISYPALGFATPPAAGAAPEGGIYRFLVEQLMRRGRGQAPAVPAPASAPASSGGPVRAFPTPPDSPLEPLDFLSTKTEPRTGLDEGGLPYYLRREGYESSAPTPPPPSSEPLRFAWGGNTPEPVVPGETDLLALEGSPASAGPPTSTFMGTRTIPGRGTLSVMNPPAVPRFGDEIEDLERAQVRVMQDEARRDLEDPLWRERARAQIWRESEVGAQMDIRQQALRQMEADYQSGLQALRSSPAYLAAPPQLRASMEENLRLEADDDRSKLMGGSRLYAPRMPSQFFAR